MNVLREVTARCPSNPAAHHAQVATSASGLRDFKYFDTDNKNELQLRCSSARIEEATKEQLNALTRIPDKAAETLGHIGYFEDLERLIDALIKEGNEKEATKVLKLSISTMKKRNILATVIEKAQQKLKQTEN